MGNTSETFDFSDFETDFAAAEGRDRTNKFVPETGNYTATISKLWRKPSQKGVPTLKWALRIADGAVGIGETLWKTSQIVREPKQLSMLKGDLMTAGLDLDKDPRKLDALNDDMTLAKLFGTRLAVSVKVTDAAKGYYNVNINRRVEVPAQFNWWRGDLQWLL